MNIVGAFGITDEDIKLAVTNGIAKVNVDTDLRIAFIAGMLESFNKNNSNIDLRKHFEKAKEMTKIAVKRKMQLLKGKI